MLKDRAYSYASKRMTTWSKFQLPGWWGLLQVITIGGFAIYLVFQLLGGGAEEGAQVTPGFENQGGSPVIAVQPEPTRGPAATEPSSEAPSPDAGGNDTTTLVDSNGSPVDVPAAAADMATRGLHALYDPEVAAQVPAAGGGTLPVNPDRSFPNATVGSLVVISASADRLSFAAATDADGDSPQFGAVTSTITVVRDGGGWAVEVS